MKKESFGKKLKEIREKQKLSQKQLAEKAGIGQQTISNWENGIREPLWSNLLALAQALEVSLDDFRN